MKNKQYKLPNNKSPKAEEPVAEYGNRITFFNSFDESENYSRKQMSELSYEQRMINLEVLRNHTLLFRTQPSVEKKIAKTFTIIKANYL